MTSSSTSSSNTLSETDPLDRLQSHGFTLDKWAQLDRFCILSSEGGTYYADERALTIENAKNVVACLQEDGPRVVRRVAEISRSGRALKNDPALFVLALAMSPKASLETRRAVEVAFPEVARIPTHVFQFCDYVTKERGWGRGLVRLIRNYYLKSDPKKLAFHAIKYQSRAGFSHRDLLRLSHPKVPSGSLQEAIFVWMNGKPAELSEEYLSSRPLVDRQSMLHRRATSQKHWESFTAPTPEQLPAELRQIWAFEQIKKTSSEPRIIELLREYRLPRECVPTEKQSPAVWEALLPNLGLDAMVRNLGNLSKHQILDNPTHVKFLTDRLASVEALKNARLHPIKLLSALSVYSGGHGIRGSGEWTVNPEIVSALEKAFYDSFGVIEPAGQRFCVAIDVSASMSAPLAKIAGLTCAKAAAAMALMLYRTEPETRLLAFNHGLSEIKVKKESLLGDIFTQVDSINSGGTNISLPIQDALQRKIETDVFVVVTDNEVNLGGKPADWLQKYRVAMKNKAKLIVLAMTATAFTVADPTDAGMLDVVGIDPETPQLVTDFAAGRI